MGALKQIAALALLALANPAQSQSATAAQSQNGPIAVADHIAINSSDPQRSAAFYREAFAMRDIPTRLPNTVWLSMGPGMTLHIIGMRREPFTESRITHLALRTHDLAATIAYFDRKGVAWSDFAGKERNIQTRFDGVRQIFVQDPDGYWIEVSDNRGTPAP